MVNGNYILYGERPPSESEIVENNNVYNRTIERKIKRKKTRANESRNGKVNQHDVDNDTDSIKYERTVKEPRLLRYIPTSEVEEHFVNDKFETYDLKPAEEPPRRYSFAKKPKNPTDGSANYIYSRSSSSCSSPNGNLPTISEHVEQYGTFRVQVPPSPTNERMSYDKKLDRYFSKPREVRKFTAKGSHPDSLYRVPASGVSAENKIMRAARLLRWPAALILVCIALAVFVYFLMPDTTDSQFMTPENSTIWSNSAGAHLQPPEMGTPDLKQQTTKKPTLTGTKTTEIDFYDSGAEVNSNDLPPKLENIPDLTITRHLPVPPVFPSHIVPEVQYGNERADTKARGSKSFIDQSDKLPEDSTLKPHITQKPEKPLAIYFKDGTGITTTSTETIINAETSNIDYQGKAAASKELNTYSVANNINGRGNEKPRPVVETFMNNQPVKSGVHFTSGHSKLFGISIEDAEKLKSTTQSSVYNTRVSPTLPVWRDVDDTTTNYPVNFKPEASDVQPLCRSPQLPMCRGVLPYDLTSMPTNLAVQDVSTLLPQFEYLVANNCSERARQFACILLEPECSPALLKPRLPCHDLCKAVMDGCDGQIPQDLLSLAVCQRYPKTNCIKARSPCFERELICDDGSCIPRDWICDGNKDCAGGEDESKCLRCATDEFRCPTGECIQKRWLCDGYTDCPKGEDEVETTCVKHKIETRQELGEESAASAPAPSVRRPNHLPAPQHLRQIEPDDSSSELLMTSDTSNPYKRNYTRRLTPYKRPIPRFYSNNDSKNNGSEANVTEKAVVNNTSIVTEKNVNSEKSIEDMVLGDINFYNEFSKELKRQEEGKGNLPSQSKPVSKPDHGRAPGPSEYKSQRITRLEKNINKFERVIDGGEYMKKKTTNSQTSLEPMVSGEDRNSYENIRNETLISAHASPCPSSELRCVDGRCITLAQLCDGTIDCTDHADEDNCYT